MRKLLVSAAMLALTTPAFAGINIDARYDYQSLTSNSVASSNQNSESYFAFNYLRLGYNSKVMDNVTFDSRLNLLAFSPTAQTSQDISNGNGAKVAQVGGQNIQPGPAGLGSGLLAAPSTVNGPLTGGVNDYVDFVEANIKLADMWTLGLGKFSDDGMGGFESLVNQDDMYLVSQGYLGNKNFLGARLAYKFADNQDLGLYFLNNDNATDNSRPGANLVYHGTFGAFGVIANYSQIGEGRQTVNGSGKDVNKNYATVGVNYSMEDWKFALDYDFYTNATNVLSSAGNNTQLNDIVASARWALNANWTPWVKLESFSRQGFQAGGTSDQTDNGLNWQVAAEYKKNATDPFRYHIAYVNGSTTYANTTSAGGANATVTGQFAFLGIKYVGDFLK